MKDRDATVRRTRMRAALPLSFWLLLLLALAGCGGGSGGSDDAPPPPGSTPTATAPDPTATPVIVSAGALDPSFGTGGSVLVPLQSDVRVPSHGIRIVDDGVVEILLLDHSAAVAQVLRVFPDGRHGEDERVRVAIDATDGTFGPNGDVWLTGTFEGRTTLTHVPRSAGSSATHTPLALMSVGRLGLLPDGGVLALGRTNETTSALERFDAAGAVDVAFGNHGLVVDPHRTDERTNSYGSVAIAADGRIVVAGTQFTFGLAFHPFVAVFDRTGRPDRSFGGDGLVVLDSIGSASVVVAPADGGAVIFVSPHGGYIRLGRSGAIDPNGPGTFLLTPADRTTGGDRFVPDEPRRFDCSIASGGVCLRLAPAVGRLRADGSPDPRFGDGGSTVTDTEPPYGAQGTGYFAFALAPLGRITVAGTLCRAPFVCDVVVARYGDVED